VAKGPRSTPPEMPRWTAPPPREPRVSERLDGGMSGQVFPACWVRSVFIAVSSLYALMRRSTNWAKVKSYL
jgi:hypothetical protein